MALCTFLLLLAISLAVTGGMDSGIIGGKNAKPHSRPYMAFIQNKHEACGGMLIREDYVLTAAHCLKNNRGHFEVLLGAHNISKHEKSQQRIQVIKHIQHPMFLNSNNEKDYSYDIMLLKLKNKAKLNKFVKVLSLPKKNENLSANVKCSVAGWGMKKPNVQTASDVLREVTVKLQNNYECKKNWQQHFNSERMFCSVSDGKHAFCRGDSGSPLICSTKPQAIASYTVKDDCLNTQHPPVFVKISYFLPWIKKNMG
ncbi:granzyme 3, tandem duplicate 1 [Danio aesculapii]|uniref:granzyme 3, tandem duplicate 1 n=1 Tax=Danio aesculapii TaxID=1142201 RepID=UPI0024BF4F62|nr:granzyme 3, tandem duplicate 1 [Danio aesculapii]